MAGTETQSEVDVTAKDLPLHCPRPGAPTWSLHPRVFLDVAKSGQARCPYCGTLYRLKGAVSAGH